MALYTTTYPNTVRVISGSAITFADDVILLCDTSSGAVTLTLQEIPSNNWNLLWKLFVLDNSNNAGTNNITINAPSGQTINLTSSIVINSNGGGFVFEISGNGSYLATPTSGGGGGGGGVSSVSASSPLASSGGSTPNITITQANGSTNGFLTSTDWSAFNSKSAPIPILNGAGSTITTGVTQIQFNTEFALLNTGSMINVGLVKNFPDVSESAAPVVSNVTNISFKTGFDVAASATPNKVDVTIKDSGWINCIGFDHQATLTSVERPKCRLIGTILYFKGTAIIPLASDLAGTTYVPPSSASKIYFSDLFPYVFQGTSGSVKGCAITTNPSGSMQLAFNLGTSIIPGSIAFSQPDAFTMGWRTYNRAVQTSVNKGTLLTTMGKLEIDKGILKLYPYNYAEIEYTGDANSIGTGRLFTATVEQSANAIDWTTSVPTGAVANSYTHSTNDIVATNFTARFPIRSVADYAYDFEVKSAEAQYLGGFMIELDGLMAFT